MTRSRPILRLARACVLLLALLAAALPARPAQAAVIAETLESIADARIQGGSPTANFPSGFLFVSTLNGHISLVRFDLSGLPGDAVIEAARLELNAPTQNDGPNNVELGRVDEEWEETAVTWATQPDITWGGPVTNVAGPTLATWDVTGLARSWQSGAAPNFGFALRGDGGEPLSFESRENTVPPRLVLRYTVPPGEGPRPDLGDAPDSSNSAGVSPNSAYPGVPGNFPTVWASTPAGQPAGPRHANQSGEAFLGSNLSRENEADSGPDQDGLNNIVAGGADNADNDRGDDGWRNRNVRFRPCAPTTLVVRVSKAAAAARGHMFLNVWFDGNRDGDWADQQLCTPEEEALAIPSTEWIVQDYFVDLTGIPAGGFVDIPINTETVLNSTPGQRHWMRFTLSEERAVQQNGRADGRGPHPGGALGSFKFGETEDVLQRPQPPGEPGALEIVKRVVAAAEPVPYGGTVSYEIRLRHVGGSQPIEARLRDLIDWPQHLLSMPDMTSPTGGAQPLQASVDWVSPGPTQPIAQLVRWQGSLSPGAEIRLSFDVHVHPLCQPNQQTVTLTNQAQAQARGATAISAEDSFTAACPAYDPDRFEVELDGAIANPLDLADLKSPSVTYNLTNEHAFPVTVGLQFEQRSSRERAAQTAERGIETITLQPGETQPLVVPIRLDSGDELAAEEELEIKGRLRYCLISEVERDCPDPARYPHLHGQSDELTIRLRPNDLGDAPDSSNHAGAAMAAYPGVPASFPTVFDPATGLPEGPRHRHPRPFHLGERVSLEAEADIGPDQDPDNNIEPAANQPNRDRGDDGSRLGALVDCQPSSAEVLVAVSQQAWNWFKAREQPAYLNVWLDSNRDGDWADSTVCTSPQGQNQTVVEHIVIDAPIDVAALGPGLHPVTVVTSRLAWPAPLAERPSWVRFTLSERPANKPLNAGGINYGDGRGYAQPFRTGESEDHLLRAQGAAPDMALSMAGRVSGRGDRVAFKIDYVNQGQAPASGAVLTLRKPEQLRDLDTVLRAPGIPAANIEESREAVAIRLPSLAPGASGSLVAGWELPAPAASPAQAVAAAEYRASAAIALAGDSDTSNNQASATAAQARRAPIVAALAGGGTSWGRADSTCRDSVRLVGKAEPNSIIAILIGLAKDGETTADAGGNFSYLLDELPEGLQRIRAVYDLQSPRDPASGLRLEVDPSLPVDPLSLSLTDSQGRSIHPPTLGWGDGAAETSARLRPGETYAVGIDSCLDDPNQQVEISLGGASVRLHDDDGDGRYTGTISLGAAPAGLAQADELRISVTSGGSVQSIGAPLASLAPGVVRDGASGAPLAGVSVTALATEAGGGEDHGPWPAAALGQPNPQTTGADGAYSLALPGGAGRIELRAAGYQSYRSFGGAGEVRLTRAITGPATHTVYITADGFVPALLRVPPGSVVEWVNADLGEHSAAGAAWDSGALAPGASYRARLGAAGSYSYGDGAAPLSQGTVIVAADEPAGFRLYLPLLRR